MFKRMVQILIKGKCKMERKNAKVNVLMAGYLVFCTYLFLIFNY